MKCIKKDGVVRRVNETTARVMTTKMGWSFMSKEDWKDITKPGWNKKAKTFNPESMKLVDKIYGKDVFK